MLKRSLLLLIVTLPSALVAQRPSHPNVILISLDQCRADRLHSYGNPRQTSPNLDHLASQGVRFGRFYSAAPWTTPSYGSMMTSQYPSKHGATIFTAPGLPGVRSGSLLLPQIFKSAGYHTGAFVNNSVAGAFLTKPGFDEYDEPRREQKIPPTPTLGDDSFRAPATNRRIFRWLDAHANSPFFLFLLYFEPHSPYDPPAEDDLFRSGKYANETNTGYDLTKGRLFRLSNLRDEDAIERLTQLYDGKIHFIDRYVGELYQELARRGLDRNTIIWITSDHGELLYSHAADYMTFDHRSLYDSVMHVPSLVIGPGVPKGKVVESLATHVDIAPTILDLANLSPKSDAQGMNLTPLFSNQKSQVHDYVFGEQDLHERLRSVRNNKFKLIWNVDTDHKQLFDIERDPGESRDVAAEHTLILTELTAVLKKWRAENEPPLPVLRSRWEEAARRSNPVTIVDDVTIGARFQLRGSGWKSADDALDYGGGIYWTSLPQKTDEERSAVWRSDSPLVGRYRVSIWYGKSPSAVAAAKAQFTVVTRNETKDFTVDQRQHVGLWNSLGVFEDPILVRLVASATGVTVADAVKFERLGP